MASPDHTYFRIDVEDCVNEIEAEDYDIPFA
jgi:hypothetical protein